MNAEIINKLKSMCDFEISSAATMLEEHKRVLDETAEAKAEAAAQGDTSENAEYTAAIERLQQLSFTGVEIEQRAERLNLFREHVPNVNFIDQGTDVHLSVQEHKSSTVMTEVYVKLMPYECGSITFDTSMPNTIIGLISINSPLGQALYGRPRTVNEVVTVEAPDTTLTYTIKEVH